MRAFLRARPHYRACRTNVTPLSATFDFLTRNKGSGLWRTQIFPFVRYIRRHGEFWTDTAITSQGTNALNLIRWVCTIGTLLIPIQFALIPKCECSLVLVRIRVRIVLNAPLALIPVLLDRLLSSVLSSHYCVPVCWHYLHCYYCCCYLHWLGDVAHIADIQLDGFEVNWCHRVLCVTCAVRIARQFLPRSYTLA